MKKLVPKTGTNAPKIGKSVKKNEMGEPKVWKVGKICEGRSRWVIHKHEN